MRSMTRTFSMAIVILLLASVSVWAGQNAGAGIRIDLDWDTNGNQNLTTLTPPPAVASNIYVDIYVINASNLDTYEFDLLFDQTKLQYSSAIEDAWRNDDLNILKKDGGVTVGWTVDSSTPGVVNIANTLVGNDPAQAPEGEGLLASVRMRVLASPPGSLSFGDVLWLDSDGVPDVGTDKGGAPILVQLAAFNAEVEKNAVILRWNTASEINNAGFEIYRSNNDSDNFTLLSSFKINHDLKGQQNSIESHEYIYKDDSVENNNQYWYKLATVDLDGNLSFHPSLSIESTFEAIPEKYQLHQNYPNPFNPETRIDYEIPDKARVSLGIYNLKGQRVRSLFEAEQEPGYYTLLWNGSDDAGQMVGSGVYILRMTAGDFQVNKRITLLR